jgi:hypothetical protein
MHGLRASFPANLLWRLGAALCRQRGGDDRLVRLYVGDGRDANARRLDDVDGADADTGQTWPGAAASFLGMWVVMMIAMMPPSLVPMLWRYRQAVGRTGETRLGRLTALVGVGYFFVWTVFGMAAFPVGVALAVDEMQLPALARAVPITVGVVVLIAAALEFTAWKAHHLACCREPRGAAGCCRRAPARPAPRPPLQLLLCRLDGDPPRHWGHGPARDGCRDG